MTDVVIVSAARTPVASFNGAFGSLTAHELGAVAIKGALERAKVSPEDVDEVILGQVLAGGEGQNPARQAAMAAGIPQEKTAWGMNQLCGSGLRSVALGLQQIANGDAKVIVAGGMESMSMAPHLSHLRSGTKMGDVKFIDSMLKDGLMDAFHGYHMGVTAENIATKWQISRDEQDAFATSSQNKAEDAQKAGRFKDEIIPVTVKTRKGDVVVDQDEYIRPGTTLDALAKIVSWATAGVDPAVMGSGPIPASRKALEKAGWKVKDLDLVEANEAFAAQAIAVNKDMGWDPSIVNVNGGAIAIGHPIGASGARVLTTLLFEMQKRGATKGLATLCIGGGMGVALTVER